MPRLVCADCELALEIEKSGVYVVVMFNDPPQPYQVWSADLHTCRRCSRKAVAGFGNRALAEHWQPGFADVLKRAEQSGYLIRQFER